MNPPARPAAAAARRRYARGEQPGQRAGAERRHGNRALRGITGEGGGEQRAVDQSARQPAPRHAGGEGLWQVACRQQAHGERLDAAPQRHAQPFEPRQGKQTGEMQAGSEHESARKQIKNRLRGQRRGHIRPGAAKRARGGACGGIARDAPGVERELPAPQVLLLQQREAGADAAAHPGAVQPGGKPAEEQRERQGESVHITLE